MVIQENNKKLKEKVHTSTNNATLITWALISIRRPGLGRALQTTHLENDAGVACGDPGDLARVAHPLHKVVQGVHHVVRVGKQEHLAGKQQRAGQVRAFGDKTHQGVQVQARPRP